MLHIPMPGSLAPRCWWKFVDVIRYFRVSRDHTKTHMKLQMVLMASFWMASRSGTEITKQIGQYKRCGKNTINKSPSTLREIPCNKHQLISIKGLS